MLEGRGVTPQRRVRQHFITLYCQSVVLRGKKPVFRRFIARLEEGLGRLLPPSEGSDMVLKQLAWENANTLCQELIRPIRKTGTRAKHV